MLDIPWKFSGMTSVGPDTVVYRVMQRSVGRVLALVESDIPVRRLSQIPPGSFAALNSDIERLAALNTTIRFRGEVQGAEQDAYRALVTRTLRRTAGHVVKLAQGKQFAQWIIGGGVYGTSGLFLAAGRARKGCE